MKTIHWAGPSITKHEIDIVEDAMRNGWYENKYDYVEKFQQEFAIYHDRKYGIMTPNCTTAIHLLLTALGVSEGDEVSIAHVARTIAKWFKYEERIKFDCDSADGQFKKTADNQKLMKLYPETEFTSIDDGIATTVEWFNITPDYLIRK